MDQRIVNIEGWMEDACLEWLEGTIQILPSNALVVELGAWKGRSTGILFTTKGKDMTVVTVDTWLGQPDLRLNAHSEVLNNDIFLDFLKSMHLLGINPLWYKKDMPAGCYYLRMESTLAPYLFNDNSVDMIFIDSDHTRFGEDIDAWMPKVKSGGVISGHDYGWGGDKETIDTRVFVEGTVESLWYGYKDRTG